jgi:hypothetical protein
MLGPVTSAPSRSSVSALGALGGCLAWAAASAPKLAWACPACLGADAKNAAFLKIGSLFVLLPFAVVALVLYVLRHAPDGERLPRKS